MEMRTDLFDFDLPEELIAAYPSAKRGEDRLLVLDKEKEQLEHRAFANIVEYIRPGDLIVFNNTRVRKARLQARKESGGRVEIFLLSPVTPEKWECLLRSSRPVKEGQQLFLEEGLECALVEKREGHALIQFNRSLDEDTIERIGAIPLPPYIMKKREVEAELDEERYQTVFAKEVGAVAAPTAGLHFTPEIIEQIKALGANVAFVTLEVGLGTFAPVKSEVISSHSMHSERFVVPQETAKMVNNAKRDGHRVIAVGTTVVRTLESAYADADGVVTQGEKSTEIFIYPGYKFNVIDAMITNFHTPRSTLVMMVSAFVGRERILAAYKEAVRREYRFFSYGDVMLLC